MTESKPNQPLTPEELAELTKITRKDLDKALLTADPELKEYLEAEQK